MLLPEGIRTIADLPHSLHDAITVALRYLSWEELPEDERPPRGIYVDGEKLKAHFTKVKKERDEKYGGKDGQSREIEDPVSNDAAKALKEQFA